MSNSVYKEFLMDASWRADQALIENFWHYSFEESQNFHRRLESNEHFLRDKWLEPDANQLHFHYFLSNLGVKKPSLISEAGHTPLITVTEHYKFSNLFQKKFKGILFVSTSTINNRMFWSLLFNASLVSKEFSQFFRQSLEELIVRVLKI